jgi:hypothetical protein
MPAGPDGAGRPGSQRAQPGSRRCCQPALDSGPRRVSATPSSGGAWPSDPVLPQNLGGSGSLYFDPPCARLMPMAERRFRFGEVGLGEPRRARRVRGAGGMKPLRRALPPAPEKRPAPRTSRRRRGRRGTSGETETASAALFAIGARAAWPGALRTVQNVSCACGIRTSTGLAEDLRGISRAR